MDTGRSSPAPLLRDALRGLSDLWLEHLEELLEAAPFGVYVDEPTRGCIYANPALLENFGVDWEDFRGFGWARHILAEDAERIQEAIEDYEHERGAIDITYRVRGKDDRVRWVRAQARAVIDATGRHLGSFCLTQDVTAERERHDRAVTSQKLEAIGKLSSQLAHDFNNLLTVMMGGFEVISEEVRSEAGREQIRSFDQAYEQARQLTHQLLLFSRRRIGSTGVCRVDEELERLATLLRSTVGEGVTLDLALDAPECHAPVTETQLAQMVLNLATNARDAMQGHGRLRISTVVDQRRVRICVEDSGPGMPPDVARRAKEPFFTTKEAGRGTGLGLATVDDLVTLAGGEVHLDSEVGSGTRATLVLPRVGPNLYVEGPAAAPGPAAPGANVLLVDDNDAVRQSLAYALAMAGHRVRAASCLADARALLREDPELDLLLSDVMLSDGYGTELAVELRANRPELPIVFVSGFVGDSGDATLEEGPITRFVPKPFRSMDVLRAMGEVLR